MNSPGQHTTRHENRAVYHNSPGAFWQIMTQEAFNKIQCATGTVIAQQNFETAQWRSLARGSVHFNFKLKLFVKVLARKASGRPHDGSIRFEPVRLRNVGIESPLVMVNSDFASAFLLM